MDVESSLPIVAIDGSTLIAADSYLSPTLGQTDPYAKYAFEYVADAFCSGAPLFYPAPGETARFASPLFKLWMSESLEISAFGVKVSDHEKYLIDLAPHFKKKLEHDPYILARHIKFQFQSPIISHYLTAGNPVSELSDFSEILGEVKLIDSIQKCLGETPVPRDLAQGSNRKLTDYELALSYLFQACAKGGTYSAGIAVHDLEPVYIHHWLRNASLENTYKQTNEEGNSRYLHFPWGTILSDMFNAQNRAIAPEKAVNVFSSIRDYSKEELNQWVFDKTAIPPEDYPIQDELINYVVNALARAKITPRYTHKFLNSKFPIENVLQEYVEKAFGPTLATWMENSLIQNMGLRNTEFSGRRLILGAPNTLWNSSFDTKNIQTAIDTHLSKRRPP